MGPDPRTRKTDPGPSLEIRLRKTDTAIPKHAACPRLRARSFNATEQMIISVSPLSSCKPQGLRCFFFYKIGGWKMFIDNDNASCLAFLLGIQQRSFIIHSIKLCLKKCAGVLSCTHEYLCPTLLALWILPIAPSRVNIAIGSSV